MIIQKIKSTIKRFNLINKADRIIVGVSGGPDSIALLYLLSSLRKEFNLHLFIAHLDHGLRKDSGKDRKFVLDLAKKLKIPAITEEVNVKQFVTKGSREEIARNIRQEFLFRIAKEIKADAIALGHNRDDQAETVIMRIIRGTGLYGLNAILPKRKIRGYTIIRPLIEISRWEIEDYLKKKRIEPRIDTSNLKDLYLRNKIRNRLLPFLEKEFNPKIKEVLANLAQTTADDYDYLLNAANRFMKKRTRFELKKLEKLHPALRRLVIRLSFAKVKGDMRRLELRHLKEIEDLILNRPSDSIVDLPQNISVIKTKRQLIIYKRLPGDSSCKIANS